jgi:hypothetical protein|tara:strand:- start:585 stop:953 length:369 start_codon:yes stop_codon:yes gene_type:complete
MFTNLPEEIERHIWKFYFSKNVVREVNKVNSVWCVPSDNLIKMCCDKGCAQLTHTDLDRILFANRTPHMNIVYEECFENMCENCIYHGFPCVNASFYGGFNSKLDQLWNTEHYQNEEDLEYI